MRCNVLVPNSKRLHQATIVDMNVRTQTDEDEDVGERVLKENYVVALAQFDSVTLTVPRESLFPFGFISPTEVFSVPGAHVSVLDLETDSVDDAVVVCENDDCSYTVEFPNGTTKEVPLALLQLCVALSASNPQEPYPVGMTVLFRKPGIPGPAAVVAGQIVRAYYDCTYNVLEEVEAGTEGGDGGAETIHRRVLHNDILPQLRKLRLSRADLLDQDMFRVRDVVRLHYDHSIDGTIVKSVGGRIHMVQNNSNGALRSVHENEIQLAVTTVKQQEQGLSLLSGGVRLSSLSSEGETRALFSALDNNNVDSVRWMDVKLRFIPRIDCPWRKFSEKDMQRLFSAMLVKCGGHKARDPRTESTFSLQYPEFLLLVEMLKSMM